VALSQCPGAIGTVPTGAVQKNEKSCETVPYKQCSGSESEVTKIDIFLTFFVLKSFKKYCTVYMYVKNTCMLSLNSKIKFKCNFWF
jgi:hypothetical protein